MPALLDQCEIYFQSRSLYDVLKIKKDATEKDIKKAYHKLSLLVHPDRVSEEEKLEATEKFKVLCKIHAILSDKNKKAVYDETGTVDDDDEPNERNWKEYWGVIFKPISEQDIINYERDYTDSDMELVDLKKAYLEGKGDIDFIMDHVPFARVDTEDRLIKIVKELIKKGEVPEYKIFTQEPERKRKRRHAKQKREAKEVEEIQKKEKENNTGDLALMIRQKQAARESQLDNFIEGLAAKYGGKKKRKEPTKKQSNGTDNGSQRKKRKH